MKNTSLLCHISTVISNVIMISLIVAAFKSNDRLRSIDFLLSISILSLISTFVRIYHCDVKGVLVLPTPYFLPVIDCLFFILFMASVFTCIFGAEIVDICKDADKSLLIKYNIQSCEIAFTSIGFGFVLAFHHLISGITVELQVYTICSAYIGILWYTKYDEREDVSYYLLVPTFSCTLVCHGLIILCSILLLSFSTSVYKSQQFNNGLPLSVSLIVATSVVSLIISLVWLLKFEMRRDFSFTSRTLHAVLNFLLFMLNLSGSVMVIDVFIPVVLLMYNLQLSVNIIVQECSTFEILKCKNLYTSIAFGYLTSLMHLFFSIYEIWIDNQLWAVLVAEGKALFQNSVFNITLISGLCGVISFIASLVALNHNEFIIGVFNKWALVVSSGAMSLAASLFMIFYEKILKLSYQHSILRHGLVFALTTLNLCAGSIGIDADFCYKRASRDKRISSCPSWKVAIAFNFLTAFGYFSLLVSSYYQNSFVAESSGIYFSKELCIRGIQVILSIITFSTAAAITNSGNYSREVEFLIGTGVVCGFLTAFYAYRYLILQKVIYASGIMFTMDTILAFLSLFASIVAASSNFAKQCRDELRSRADCQTFQTSTAFSWFLTATYLLAMAIWLYQKRQVNSSDEAEVHIESNSNTPRSQFSSTESPTEKIIL